MMLSLAEMLGKSLSEIKQLPASELTTWNAYMLVKDERSKPKEESNNGSDLDNFKRFVHDTNAT